MTVIRFAGFQGENRALHPMLLPENVGAALRHIPSTDGRRLFGHRSLSIPSSIYTVLNSLEPKAGFFNPIYQRFCFPESGYKSVSSGVSMLLRCARPPAIFRGVISIIVFSIKRHSFWARGHIRNKIGKPINSIPSGANTDASATIVFKLAEPRIVAAMPHLRPCGKKGVVFTPFDQAVGCYGLNVVFSSKAPTRSSVTTPERMGVNKSLLATLANTFPFYGPVALGSRPVLHSEPTKHLSRKINERTHFLKLLGSFASIVLCKSLEVATKSLARGRV